MRDILQDIFGDEPLDPRQVARASLRPKTRERFYKSASAAERAPFAVMLALVSWSTARAVVVPRAIAVIRGSAAPAAGGVIHV